MNRSAQVPLFLIGVALTCLTCVLSAAEQEAAMGAVEGTISYRADVKRPWRYARYYVANSKTGYLSEAVVALQGKALKGGTFRSEPQTQIIDQKSFQFVPEIVSIRAGDSVCFRNSDPQTHSVMASSSLANFNVNTLVGADYTHKFERAGGIDRPVRVGCAFHGAMRAWIYVFDHLYHQITQPDGQFHFQDVPAGEYDLEIRHPAGELRWKQRIEVQAGQTLRLEVQLSPDNKIAS